MTVHVHNSLKKTTLNRLQHTGSSDDDELKHLKESIEKLQSDLEAHKLVAKTSQEYHLEMVKRCTTQWRRIAELQGKTALSPEEEKELSRLKQLFSLTIGADYQMSKFVPSWGTSPQPGSTYYLQKLSHNIFGIDNYYTSESSIYIFDERLGPKNLDHTISYFHHYLSNVPSWIKRVHIFLDNAGSTNKNA